MERVEPELFRFSCTQIADLSIGGGRGFKHCPKLDAGRNGASGEVSKGTRSEAEACGGGRRR